MGTYYLFVYSKGPSYFFHARPLLEMHTITNLLTCYPHNPEESVAL